MYAYYIKCVPIWALVLRIWEGWRFSGRRRRCAIYYTSPQSFIIKFSFRWLSNVGHFYWILIVIYRHFLCHQQRCTSILWPLSYPFRSLEAFKLCFYGKWLRIWEYNCAYQPYFRLFTRIYVRCDRPVNQLD